MNCLNCQYPDCINDELAAEELNFTNVIDDEIQHDNANNQQKNFKRWYHENINNQHIRNHENYLAEKDYPGYKDRVYKNIKVHRDKKKTELLERRAEKRKERLRKKREYNKVYNARKKAERVS
jgi:hypothetical protein